MKYQDAVEQSAEYLRLALPLMSRQSAALHPVCYAVWYEYVAGRNPQLKSEIDALTAGGKKLTDAQTFELYDRHIAEPQERLVNRINAALEKALDAAESSTSEAGQHASSLGNLLTDNSDKLEQALSSGPLSEVLQQMLTATRSTVESLSAVENKLKESSSEVSRLRADLAKAKQETMTDALSNIANRKAFDQALLLALQEPCASEGKLCLIMADIDHFKNVNDSYGHVFGDKVIKGVAQIMKLAVKGRDTVARYGGEEFAIILPDTPLVGAKLVAEQIRQSIATSKVRLTNRDEVVSHITASFGAACHHPGESAEAFIARADAALYASKENGRNRVTANEYQKEQAA